LSESIKAAAAQTLKSFTDFIAAWEMGPDFLAALKNPSAEDFLWALGIIKCVPRYQGTFKDYSGNIQGLFRLS
jgi:hypothetical protein